MQFLPGSPDIRVSDSKDRVQTGPCWPLDSSDRDRAGVVCFDRWHSVRTAYGNVTVSVETDRTEHHSTTRAQAIRFVKANLPAGWVVNAYLGREHYRSVSGYPAYAKLFSVVYTDTGQEI